MYINNMKYTEHSRYCQQSHLVKILINYKEKKEIVANINQMLAHCLYFYSMNFNRVFKILLDTLKIDNYHTDFVNLDLRQRRSNYSPLSS